LAASARPVSTNFRRWSQPEIDDEWSMTIAMPTHRAAPWRAALAAALAALLPAAAACNPELTAEDAALLATMELRPDDLPPSPTNAHSDDPAAAELGRRLFFDRGMSADGQVACARCHVPDQGFSSSRPLPLGVDDREGARHSMPITALPFQRFLLWDGRADSLWSQPLRAIEAEAEMDFTRVEVTRFVEGAHRAEYEAVFGPLPDVAELPERARPGLPAWEQMTAEQQDQVNRVFTNVGKAIEAYERRLTCTDTRFDRWARGEVELGEDERIGAAKFVVFGCIDCHSGPSFSDGEFHNIGIGSGLDQPDTGRAGAVDALLADPFNGAGAYSDDPEAGRALLDSIEQETGSMGAFRTAGLRGAGQRHFFGHRGHEEFLSDFIDDVYDDPHLQDGAIGQLDPEAADLGVTRPGGLASFLQMLDCPPLPPELLEP
jgi:cytochrome c peroxidase